MAAPAFSFGGVSIRDGHDSARQDQNSPLVLSFNALTAVRFGVYGRYLLSNWVGAAGGSLVPLIAKTTPVWRVLCRNQTRCSAFSMI